MNVLDRIEQFGERMYKHVWFRVFLLIFFFIFNSYIALWCHEFMHYVYATLVLKSNAYIQYGFNGVFGWCVVENHHDFWLYYIGGIGTTIVFAVYLFSMLSLPNRLTLPLEFSLTTIVAYHFIYAHIEVLTLYYGYVWLYNPLRIVAEVLVSLVVLKMFWSRIVEYLGGDAK